MYQGTYKLSHGTSSSCRIGSRVWFATLIVVEFHLVIINILPQHFLKRIVDNQQHKLVLNVGWSYLLLMKKVPPLVGRAHGICTYSCPGFYRKPDMLTWQYSMAHGVWGIMRRLQGWSVDPYALLPNLKVGFIRCEDTIKISSFAFLQYLLSN